jgi:hypothetical protein
MRKWTQFTAIAIISFFLTSLSFAQGFNLHCPNPEIIDRSAIVRQDAFGTWVLWKVAVHHALFTGKIEINGLIAPSIGILQHVRLMGEAVTCIYTHGLLHHFGSKRRMSRWLDAGGICTLQETHCDALPGEFRSCPFQFCRVYSNF